MSALEQKRYFSTLKFFEGYEITSSKKDEVLGDFNGEIGQVERHGYKIRRVANLLSLVSTLSRLDHSGLKFADKMETAALLEIDGPDTDKLHDRVVLLLKNKNGERAFITVVLHGLAPGILPQPGQEYDTILHGPAYFGGAGLYPVHDNTDSMITDAIQHSESLAATMTEKGWFCGVNKALSGTKVIITGEAWVTAPEFQFITGMMFSKRGPFPHIITGSDARQTPQTIAMMERGSKCGNGVGQIVGTENGLPDTASYVKHSMKATYLELQKLFPQKLKKLTDATVAVQGIGKIGSSTALMFLEAGSQVYIADVFPTQTKNFLNANRRKYSGRIHVVSPEEIWDIKADIFSPCSSQERIINLGKIDRLANAEVSLILSGANNPLSDPEIAEYARTKNIFTPPDPLSNNGSATAAALEVRYVTGVKSGKYTDSQEFIRDVLIPHIYSNIAVRVPEMAAISFKEGISLFNAGHLAYKRWQVDTLPITL